MHKLLFKFFSFFILMTTAFSTESFAQQPIQFEVSFKEPQAHYVEVKMEIPEVNAKTLDVKMPVWAPGSYLVREFSKNVEGFQASAPNGNPLPAVKTRKNTWQITTNGQKTVVVRYRVYAYEVSVRTSFVDDSHAFLSPTGIFMYVNDQIDRAAEVVVKPFSTWSKISTGLEPVQGRTDTFQAANFDILFDSPIEVGNQDIFEFTAAGVRHEVAMYGGGNYDKERLKQDMAKIVDSATSVYGENPNKHYVFIVHNYQSGGGGLEHLNSTVLGAARFNYGTETGYKSFLGLVAHEYFHLWNIKRLRPVALGPFNYDEENYTTNLWIGEGFTAYYDNLLVRRAGFYSVENYLHALAGDVAAVENRPGNHVQPLSEASFDAWIKYYRPNENAVNTQVSYYNKGALIAMMMDITILQATNGEKGLDDVMKLAYEEFYKKRNKGYTDAEFKALAEKVAGKSLDDLYTLVNTASSPNYNTYLNVVGLALVDLNEGNEEPDLGIRTSVSDNKLIVQSVLRESGAWKGGINVNDELIGINGVRIDAVGKELNRVIQSAKPGDTVKLLVSRDGLLKEVHVTLTANMQAKFAIVPLSNASDAQLSLREKWLGRD